MARILDEAFTGSDREGPLAAGQERVTEGMLRAREALLAEMTGLDADTARATISHDGMIQTVEIHVAPDGRPLSLVIPRWSNANPAGEYRLQPFGGTLSDFREVVGYRLPFRVDGGNFFGTEDYFPFFRAEVTAIRMLPREPRP